MSRHDRVFTGHRGVVMLVAGLAFVLAFASPMRMERSDPAIALLASQSILDNGTLDINAYLGDERLAYDLLTDYRIKQGFGRIVYHSVGVPVLSVPFVWAANRLGYHMLDQADEFALQNLLSALCCALVFVLLYRFCRCFCGRSASLVVASVGMFGSPLISTLATGLWNAGYAMIFLLLAAIHLARGLATADGGPAPDGRINPAWLMALAVLAVLCRPIAAIAVVATLACLALTPSVGTRRATAWLLAGSVLLMVAAAVLPYDAQMQWAGRFRYYSPARLIPPGLDAQGIAGVLISPSRGLLVYCPYLLVVVVASVLLRPAPGHALLFRIALVWIVAQVVAVGIRGMWWGGHSFGPRMLAELIIPFTLITCLAWRQSARGGHGRWRPAICLYLVLGVVAVAIHSGQGLFNPYVQRWNESPDIDQHTDLLYDWRYPQWLAGESSIAARLVAMQRQKLVSYTPGEIVGFDSEMAIFPGWSVPEDGWRWSDGHSAAIVLDIGTLPGGSDFRLSLVTGGLGHQRVAVSVNGTLAGSLSVEGMAAVRHDIEFPRALLREHQLNTFDFSLPDARRTRDDARRLGLRLVSLRLEPAGSSDRDNRPPPAD